MLIMKTTKRLKDIRIVLSIRHWVMDYGEKVISGLMEGGLWMTERGVEREELVSKKCDKRTLTSPWDCHEQI